MWPHVPVILARTEANLNSDGLHQFCRRNTCCITHAVNEPTQQGSEPVCELPSATCDRHKGANACCGDSSKVVIKRARSNNAQTLAKVQGQRPAIYKLMAGHARCACVRCAVSECSANNLSPLRNGLAFCA